MEVVCVCGKLAEVSNTRFGAIMVGGMSPGDSITLQTADFDKHSEDLRIPNRRRS